MKVVISAGDRSLVTHWLRSGCILSLSGFQVPDSSVNLRTLEKPDSLRTFKFMLHESHWIIRLLGIHLLDSWAEASNWQHNNVSDLLSNSPCP